jgi:membrane protein YqaA with SNARE-associated domain
MKSFSDFCILFAASFGAATILPGSSEVVLYMMISRDHSLSLLFAVATAGNYLGALVNYYLGRFSAIPLAKRMEGGRYRLAMRWFSRWGHLSLLLSWVPIVGDPLTVIAGLTKMRVLRFSLWVLLGKGGRYAVLILLSQ